MRKLVFSCMLLAGCSLEAWAGASCTLNSKNQTVTICAPAAGASGLTSPVHVNAGTTDTHAIVTMWIYIDGVKVFFQNRVNFIDTNIKLAPGKHRLSVPAKDTTGLIFRAVETITVGGSPAVTVSPSLVTLLVGAQQQFTANVAVTWSASCGSIDSTGLYTAPNQPGTCTVTATDGSGNTGTATVSVVAVQVTPSSVTLLEGAQQQFTANTQVTWSASCGSIDNTGLYTAPNQTGSCTVTATDSGGHQGAASVTVVAQTSVTGYLTWKNDNARTGQQRNETILTPANVNSAHFGKRFSETVDGYIFGQPLYVANLSINGTTHNVVFVATEHDSVYAFDADSGGSALWHRSFLSPGVTPVPSGNVGATILPEVGITGTPVIDPDSQTLYVVAETLENGGSNYVFRLHAMDLARGAEKTNSPVVISTSGFQPKEQLQRAALLLANGLVYITFASQGDHTPYQGWILAYDPASLALQDVWDDEPTGTKGGIWMSGAGSAADSSGNLYVMVGNGTWDPSNGDFGDSFVKLNSSLSVVDYFTPFDQAADNAGDIDVGAGGPLLVPDQSGAHPHLLIGCGKPKWVYVLDRDNMGKFHAGSDSQIVQSLANVVGAVSSGGFDPTDHCFMTPAYWEQNVYFAGNHDVIKAFHLDPGTGLLSTSPTSKGSFFYQFPGGQPVVSSNGSTDGIVWVMDFSSNSSSTLHAYDATNVANELYNSNQAGSRDTFGTGSKWATPTVINGKVYVGGKGHLTVYGPL